MWNIATSSPPEKSRGSAKKLRANTSSARCRARSGKRSRSSTSAALRPSRAEKVLGKATSSRPSASATSTRARSRAVNEGERSTKPITLHGGVRGMWVKESRMPSAASNG